MIRQPEREKLNRLMVKTLDQVFIMRATEGLGMPFEAEPLTNLVKQVYFPWLSQQTTAFGTHQRLVRQRLLGRMTSTRTTFFLPNLQCTLQIDQQQRQIRDHLRANCEAPRNHFCRQRKGPLPSS